MNLENIVPWGRSFAEYVRMFALTADDLALYILGCGDGPASFNGTLTRQGGRVVSCDPLYRSSAGEIEARIAATRGTILAQLHQLRDRYVWDFFGSPAEVGRVRQAAMAKFLADYVGGREAGRYLAGELPELPFAPRQFDLALCSHLLFLYSAQLSLDFHRAALRELCRVAREVRIFPLVDLAGKPSPYVEPLAAELADLGYAVEFRRVSYEFQRGADTMLRLVARGPA